MILLCIYNPNAQIEAGPAIGTDLGLVSSSRGNVAAVAVAVVVVIVVVVVVVVMVVVVGSTAASVGRRGSSRSRSRSRCISNSSGSSGGGGCSSGGGSGSGGSVWNFLSPPPLLGNERPLAVPEALFGTFCPRHRSSKISTR